MISIRAKASVKTYSCTHRGQHGRRGQGTLLDSQGEVVQFVARLTIDKRETQHRTVGEAPVVDFVNTWVEYVRKRDHVPHSRRRSEILERLPALALSTALTQVPHDPAVVVVQSNRHGLVGMLPQPTGEPISSFVAT